MKFIGLFIISLLAIQYCGAANVIHCKLANTNCVKQADAGGNCVGKTRYKLGCAGTDILYCMNSASQCKKTDAVDVGTCTGRYYGTPCEDLWMAHSEYANNLIDYYYEDIQQEEIREKNAYLRLQRERERINQYLNK